MASEQHINLLRQGFEVWNLWRQENPQVIPELKGADLAKLNLFKVDLSKTDLSEVNFSGTSLYRANLSGANLYKANLNTTIIQETNLSGASLIEANLENNTFPQTNFHRANFYRANLAGTKFYQSTDISETNFSFANLSRADFGKLDLSNLNFNGANLSYANLSQAKLHGTKLFGTDLSQVNLQYTDEKWYLVWDIVNNGAVGRNLQGVDLSMTDLEGANLFAADLSNVNLTGTKLNRANLANSNLVNANLTQADLRMANLSMANLRKANLWGADLRNADLSSANLSEVSLKYVKLHHARIQEAIISEKWYLVWDVLNNGAEGRDLSGVDLSEADLSAANFKNANLSGSNLSNSILNDSNFSWADFSGANLARANFAGANCDWADFSRANLARANFAGANCNWADFSEAKLRGVLINCYGASFSQTNIFSDSLNEFNKQQVKNFIKANISQEYRLDYSCGPIENKKEFFDNLLGWKNQESFNKSIQKLLSSSKNGFIPGILLYTDEDEKLSVYVREHFDALDRLTGDWCTIYLLENPSPKWRKANQNWKKMIENSSPLKWFRSKPYDKSEAYDIARELGVDVASLPCLILISPANLSEKLILPIIEISTEYFRQLFSTIEKLVKSIVSEKLREKEANFQVFDHLELNFRKIENFNEEYHRKQKGSNSQTSVYIIKDQSRSFTVETNGGNFNPIGSPIMSDGFTASGTIAESINVNQNIPKVADMENQQDQ